MSVMRLRPIAEVILNSEEEAPLILPHPFNIAEEDSSEVPKLYPPGRVIFIHRNEIQARLVQHRNDIQARLVQHRNEIQARLVQHRNEIQARLVQHRNEIQAR